MTAENFEALLTHLSNRQPYRPFLVELRTGERFEIDHPRAYRMRDGVMVFLKPEGITVWFDHESVNQIIDAPSSYVSP